LSIIDLSARLGFPPTEPSARHVIIVVQIGEQVAGLLVDAVTGILAAKPDAILPTPDVASELAHNFIAGVLAIDDRMINLVGLDYVMPQTVRIAA
jgi:purine-binding chemotaxis protein CheW